MRKLILIVAAVAILILPTFAGAATVLEDVFFLKGPGYANKTYSFPAHPTAPKYQVIFTDIEDPVPFDYLRATVTTSAGGGFTLEGPGMGFFDAIPGTETYFANVLGLPGEFSPNSNVPTERVGGLFGLKILAVPIPGGVALLLSGLFGVLLLRQRNR